MKFMVIYRTKPGTQNELMENFELRGPNRNPGTAFRSAWVSTQKDAIFVLGESVDEAHVLQACHSWDPTGDFEIFPVIDIEQF